MLHARMLAVLAVVCALINPAIAQELPNREELRMTVQEICPVSGNRLGVHGRPVKANIGDSEVFLCCRACLQGKVNGEHWATIHRNFAKAQRICPVMGHELPANAEWTVVQGQVVYVCCPPCIEKIRSNPKAFLDRLDNLYASSLRQQAGE